jgi:methionyl-tRNA formyltransferase
MFDTIILLTGAAEHSVFTTVLRGHNPHLTVLPVFTAEDLAAVGREWLGRARLIAFTTTVIVPPDVLDQLGYGAYNFHPGSPNYPGWAPAHFALYDDATEFGGTVHRMVRRVDAGPIVDVEMFAVPEGVSVSGLEELTYTRLVQMFWRLAKALATEAGPLIERAVRWSGKRSSQNAYRAMCDIPLTIPKDELQRRIKVFGANHFGISPTVRLHGVPFRAVPSEVAEA